MNNVLKALLFISIILSVSGEAYDIHPDDVMKGGHHFIPVVE